MISFLSRKFKTRNQKQEGHVCALTFSPATAPLRYEAGREKSVEQSAVFIISVLIRGGVYSVSKHGASARLAAPETH